MSSTQTVLLLGGTGRTGLCVLDQLTARGVRVRAIVRSPDKIPADLRARPTLGLVEASLLELSGEQLAEHARGCAVVVSCLGHVLTWRGVFGAPRNLVTLAVERVVRAVRASGPTAGVTEPVKLILMSSVSVNRPAHADTRRGALERGVVALIRFLVPPAKDNQTAADFLVHELGPDDARIGWVVVRPDTLIEGEVGEYDLREGLVDSLFSPGKTTMNNIGHFIAELATVPATFANWRGKFPVIVDRRSVA